MPGTKYSAEVKARAIRLAGEHKDDHGCQWAAITGIARRPGIGSADLLASGAGRRRPVRSGGTR